MNPIRVLFVDDHPLMREGVALMLQEEADLDLAGQAGTGEEAIVLYQNLRPDVTIVDLRLPGMSGVETILKIRSMDSAAMIVALTTFPGDVLAAQAIQAGASGYLLKTSLRRDLIDTLRAVHRGECRIPAHVASALARPSTEERLTSREIVVLREVATGLSNKIVANRLAVSEATIKGHLRSILQKLKANDRTHAVTIAIKRGYIEV